MYNTKKTLVNKSYKTVHNGCNVRACRRVETIFFLLFGRISGEIKDNDYASFLPVI